MFSLPSYLPAQWEKKIFRYVLTHLDFLEDATLADLSNLEGSIGYSNLGSTLKNVNIKVDRLKSFLPPLPPRLHPTHAVIGTLTIKIPTNVLLSGSIEIHLSNLHLRCSLLPPTTTTTTTSSSSPTSSTTSSAYTPDATESLARSFLRSQPSADQSALLASLAPPDHDTDSDDDDDADLGTGTPLQLPGMLARVFAGVLDRLVVSVRGITIALDATVDGGTVVLEAEVGDIEVGVVGDGGKRRVGVDGIDVYVSAEEALWEVAEEVGKSVETLREFAIPTPTRVASPEMMMVGGGPDAQSDGDESDDDEVLAFAPSFRAGGQHLSLGSLGSGLGSGLGLGMGEDSEDDSDDGGGAAFGSVILPPQTSASPASASPASTPSRKSSPTIPHPTSSPTPPHPTSPIIHPTTPPPPAPLSDHSSESDSEMDAAASHLLSESTLFTHSEAGSLYHSATSGFHSPSTHHPHHTASSASSADEEAIGQEEMDARLDALLGDITTGPDDDDDDDDDEEDPEPAPPEATRIRRKVLSVGKIEARLPGAKEHEKKELEEMEKEKEKEKEEQHVPGAFSMYASRRGLSPPRRRATVKIVAPEADQAASIDLGSGAGGGGGKEVEVEVGGVDVAVDFGGARVLGMVVGAMKAALSEVTVRRREKEKGKGEDKSGMGVSVAVSEVVLRLLDGSDTILQCVLSGIKVAHSPLPLGASTSRVEIRKVALGDGIVDILSFTPAPPPPPPTSKSRKRPTLPQQETDVTVVLSQNATKKRINVTTLPLKLHLDLKRLEATLRSFGGVGGVLASTSTTASTVTLPPKQREEVAGGVDVKVSCFLGGVHVQIVGTRGSVGVETSPVKIRSESEGPGGVVVGIEKIRVFEDPGASVLIEQTRVEFLGAPGDEDLARLLELLTPSKEQFADDDDILIDTLLRQRQQGSALRIGVGGVKVAVEDLGVVGRLGVLGEEVVKVLTVTDFVAQDERPGLLTLLHVNSVHARVEVGGGVGTIEAVVRDVGVAHVSAPALVAVALGKLVVRRNGSEELLGEALEGKMLDKSDEGKHMLMLRIIGDELEPVVKLKLWNCRVEYRVETLMALTTATPPEKVTAEVLANEMVMSVIEVAEKNTREEGPPLGVDVLIRDCVLGLNPLGLKSRGLVVLTDARLQAALPSRGLLSAGVEVKKAFVMLIDDTANLLPPSEPRRKKPKVNRHHDGLTALGYVSVVEVSSARITLQIIDGGDGGDNAIDLEVHDDLLLMESCADSTQTLLGIVNGLKPPLVEDEAVKYCTQVMEVDMFRSLTEDAFLLPKATAKKPAAAAWHPDDEDDGDLIGDDVPTNLTFVESYYGQAGREFTKDELADSMLDGDLGSIAPAPRKPLGVGEKGLFASFTEQIGMCDDDPLQYVEDHFGKARVRTKEKKPVGQAVNKWDSVKNQYVSSTHPRRAYFPLRVKVRDVHLIWNLHDGYDWPRTRDTISAAVKKVESQAAQRRDRRVSFDVDDDEESVIGDFLFNSIYIGIPANRDPRELSKAIAKEFDDHMSETSFAPSTAADSSRPSSRSRNTDFGRGKNLKLSRSKTHKLQFELKGVCVDFLLFPPSAGETQSSVDVRVRDLEIIDNVPTSTWKKFVTYMQDAGGRETGSNMVHLEMMNVRPVPELAASEIVLKVTVLPLRLHVDQDTLDFMTRFFEFKDDTVTAPDAPGDIPFLQRVEVNSIRVKLDYKPKKVDYAGLRSGRTTEFMNFFILEEADMVLRHCVVYGISGFPRMGQVLNDTWTPDVKNTQLGDVLAGVAPVRSLANIGGGIKDLVAVPMREYKKDGRIVRAVQKGAMKFAKTTTSELVRLGAKVAVGTQNVLQGAEDFLVPMSDHQHHHHHHDADSEYAGSMSDSDDDIVLTGGGGGGGGGGGAGEKKSISLYADQPMTVVQGLRGASDSLRRNFGSAKNAIMDVPRDIAERGSAQGAAVAVARAAPVAIIRPMIGATEAVSRTLLGVTNALDPEQKRRVDDKYKKH